MRYFLVLLALIIMYSPTLADEPIRGVYLGSNAIGHPEKRGNVLFLIKEREINAVAVDKKDDFGHEFTGEAFARMVAPLKGARTFIICRIVVFKFRNLDLVLNEGLRKALLTRKSRSTEYWRNYAGDYFFDPASKAVLDYTKQVARRAIDDGCDELNFDYIRFPSDGNLKDIEYPSGDKTWLQKRDVMWAFISRLGQAISEKKDSTPRSADLFGYAAMKSEPGIGQFVEDFIKAGFKVYGMFYPSHYNCRDFGLENPNSNPYITVRGSVRAKLRYLKERGMLNGALNGMFTAWIQGNDSTSYQCNLGRNKLIFYFSSPPVLRSQIQGIEDTLAHEEFRSYNLKPSWIVWHSSGIYNPESYLPKNPKER